jgi:DNA-directed RNA polymerase specialized sigma24 family protein
MGICLRYSNSDQQAQEILNDSFLKVFENILITPEILVFRAWLRKIVVIPHLTITERSGGGWKRSPRTLPKKI